MGQAPPPLRESLVRHPDFRAGAVDGLAAEAARRGPTGLVLRYELAGRLGDLAIPAAAPPERTDELWRHSCFEAFVAAGDPAGGYVELNFSPSSQWAAYGFSSYREGMAAAAIAAPSIEARFEGGRRLRLDVSLDLAGLLPADTAWRVALTAVVEAADGRKSYWALAHPPGRPDFHHAAGFAAVLGP
ncbi:MAG TPA: DOMON-like domain-containing protein [Caulobacteraceae bacterium]|jgi:hypothetical protein